MAQSKTPGPLAQAAPVFISDKIRNAEGAGLNSQSNVPATKQFVFNETGNIFVASTINGDAAGGQGNGSISPNALKAFEDVSVFYAAMTKAISTTIDPATQKSYSLYNYAALEKVISNSGLFALVTQESVDYESSSWGASLSIGFIEALIGFATPMSLVSSFSSLIRSMGKEAITMGNQTKHSDAKVGTVVFVCEYLLGAVSISTLLVYADVTENYQAFQLGACFKEHSQNVTWHLNKDTYLFIPPSFIKEANSMNEAMANADYLALVETLKGSLEAPVDASSPSSDTPSSSTPKTPSSSSASKKSQ